MATHSSILAWRIPRGAWWATVHRVTKSRTQLSDWAHTDACKAFMGPRPFHLCGFLLPFYTHTHTHTHTHTRVYTYIYTHIYVCIIKVFYDCICIKVNIFWVISVFILIQSMGLNLEQEIRHLHGSLKALWAWCPMPTASNGEIIHGISEEEKPVHQWQSQGPATPDCRPRAHPTLSSFCLKHFMGCSSTGGVCSRLLPVVIK